MKYRKKSVVVEAFKLGHDVMPDWFNDAIDDKRVEVEIIVGFIASTSIFRIKTLEGVMIANYGDYIIKGIQGELYPCKAAIFEETYELVE